MKSKRLWRTVILCGLAGIVLCGGIFLLWRRGDWRYAVECALRVYPVPEMEEVEFHTGRVWKLDALALAPNVTWSDALMCIRSDTPLPSDFVPQLAEIDGAQMHPDMIAAYLALREAVEAETGERLYITDDYRTSEEQESLVDTQSKDTVAAVGCSEHEAGLALDVCVKGYGGKSFLKTEAGRMVNRMCGDYGFVIRYGQGKQEITGMSYEPWHLRYVGQPHARIMMESNLTLEEYLGFLTWEQWFSVGEYLILATKLDTVILPDGWVSCDLSSDNRGNTVITLNMK